MNESRTVMRAVNWWMKYTNDLPQENTNAFHNVDQDTDNGRDEQVMENLYFSI